MENKFVRNGVIVAACSHPVVVGDKYGESCEICGFHIKGFGYGGRDRPLCKHSFYVESSVKACIYCGYVEVVGGFSDEC